MAMIVAKFTVYFDDPFWVGLYERSQGSSYEACKITFGAEPKDYEVHEYLRSNWSRLRFSPAIEMESVVEKTINPKRMQREIQKQLQTVGIGTKAQKALKLQYEENKAESRACSRQKKEAEKQRQFQLKQEKRKEKHRGH